MRKREAPHLVVTDVVIALVDTSSVGSGLECLGDVLNVWEAVHEDVGRPAGLALRHRVEVDWTQCDAQRTVRFSYTGANGGRTAYAPFLAL